MGVISMRHLVFKQNKNVVDVYINNQLFMFIQLNSFTNYHKPYILNTAIHNFLSAEQTEYECNIKGCITITCFGNDTTSLSIVIEVGSDSHSVVFDRIGKDMFYDNIIRYIIDTLQYMQYSKYYKPRSIRNLWGLLR
jgi:hypothetical protein